MNRNLIILCSFFLVQCAVSQISASRKPIKDELIERKVEINTVSSPTFNLKPDEELTAYTEINPNFVLKLHELIRKRHHYNEIKTYKKKLHPILKYTLLGGSLGSGVYGTSLLAGETGYVALGRDLIGIGVLIAVPTIIFSGPKEFEKKELGYDDDKGYSSFPLTDLLLEVNIIDSPYTLSLSTDTAGIVQIPADSIIKLCPEKNKIDIKITSKDKPSLNQQLTISNSFITSFKKFEELKKQEQIRLAKLEKERKKIEAKVNKIINKAWKDKNEVCDDIDVYFRSDSSVDIYYTMSREHKKGIIDAIVYSDFTVIGAVTLFKTDILIQFGKIAPKLFKKPYVKKITLSATVNMETPYGYQYPYSRAVTIEMSHSTAKKINWVKDYMKKRWKIADKCYLSDRFYGFLITYINELYWEGWR